MSGLPAALVRGLLYPLHERLRGRPTVRELRTLRRLARLDPAGAADEARGRLGALLAFAAREIPYYAGQCSASAGADPEAALARLPVLRKAEIRAHGADLVWPKVPGGLLLHSSGGTTGDTLHFYIDHVRQAQDLAARLFMQSRFGAALGERRMHLWGSPLELRGVRLARWRDRLLNERLLDAFDLSPAALDRHLAQLCGFRPAVLYGYSSAVALLARHALQRAVPGEFAWLRLVVMTGEESTPEQRSAIQAAFRCPVAAEYGSREVGLIAHECPRGRLHVVAPHLWVEVCKGGRPAPAGSCGEVICTTLNVRAQPFIRYSVGDVARAGDAPRPDATCRCGLPWPVLELVGGKVTGFIALPGGRLCHGAVTSHMLRGEQGIVEFKTYQHTLDAFEVLLTVDERFRPETLDRIPRRYRALFGPHVQVDCRIVPRIPPDPSGKRRYVVSAVASAGGEFAVCPGATS